MALSRIDQARKAVLRGFLLHAEGMGWVSNRGFMLQKPFQLAMNWWQGVVAAQSALGTELFDDVFFDRLLRADPVKTSHHEHIRLCAQDRAAKRAAVRASAPPEQEFPEQDFQREGWMA
jgi:hypothetical protein